jgi:hypothetical protein
MAFLVACCVGVFSNVHEPKPDTNPTDISHCVASETVQTWSRSGILTNYATMKMQREGTGVKADDGSQRKARLLERGERKFTISLTYKSTDKGVEIFGPQIEKNPEDTYTSTGKLDGSSQILYQPASIGNYVDREGRNGLRLIFVVAWKTEAGLTIDSQRFDVRVASGNESRKKQ